MKTFTKFPALMLISGLLAGANALAQHEHHAHDEPHLGDETELGTVRFEADCDEAARAGFDRGLALMHHMMYAQARTAFVAVRESDPDCAMAWWGEATSLFQPLWGTRPSDDELARGWDAIRLAAQGVERAREQALIEATYAFFRDPETADFRDRLQGWTEGMERAWQDWPDDHDVAALHALALLTRAMSETERRAELHDRAEDILRAVWQEEPSHPGAIHYTIHATDVDGRAENALDMVEAYGRIAPHTAHALHMPSHIYVRLGEWDEVIDWNVRSAEAALDHPVNGSVSHHYIHAVDYLIYAYLQRGEDALADRIHREANRKGRHQASFVSAFHFAAVPARLAVERRQWEQARALPVTEPDYLPWDQAWWPEALSWFARGLGHVHLDEIESAEEAAGQMTRLAEQARAAGETGMATYIEIDRLILAGWIEQARGRTDAARATIYEAVELEGSVEKHPVTPGALYPPREALGDLLLAQDRPAEALEAYRSAERIWPGRYNTHLGAARAAEAAGLEGAAREHYRSVLDLARDSERSGIQEALSFLRG